MAEEEKRLSKGDWKWMYAALPASIASGPIGTLVVLYIAQLGGNVISVAYAITLGSVVSIPATMFWGRVTDMVNKRKVFMLIAYLSVALTLLALHFTNNINTVILIYGAYSFFVAANAAAISLLVMETTNRVKWALGFSRLQLISSIGGTLGYVVAYAVTGFASLNYLILAMFLISVISIVMSLRLIYEPKVLFGSEHLIRSMFIATTRMLIFPLLLIIKLPSTKSLQRIFNLRLVKSELFSYFSIFAFASLLFYLGSGTFNTVYPLGLRESGLTASQIFSIFLLAQAIQSVIFYSYSRVVKNRPNTRIAMGGLLLRGLAYIAIGIIFLFAGGTLFYGLNALTYAISSGLAYSLFYISSNVILFQLIKNKQRGQALGAYGSLTGTGSVAGALLSGYLVNAVGYWFVFVVSGALMLITLSIFSRFKQ